MEVDAGSTALSKPLAPRFQPKLQKQHGRKREFLDSKNGGKSFEGRKGTLAIPMLRDSWLNWFSVQLPP